MDSLFCTYNEYAVYLSLLQKYIAVHIVFELVEVLHNIHTPIKTNAFSYLKKEKEDESIMWKRRAS